MKMKLFATTLVIVLASAITLPVFAGTPKTPADCERIYAGDSVAIQNCIASLDR